MSDERPRLAWGHININVSDLDRSVAFYEKLGFEPFMSAIPYLGLVEGPVAKELSLPSARVLGLPASTKGRACIMQLGRTFPKLDLTEWDESSGVNPLTNADAGIVRICLASQGLVADHARLSEAGVEFLTAPEGCEDGLAEVALCRDPEGIGHTSCLPAQRPSMGVMLNTQGEPRDGNPLPASPRSAFWSA